MWLIVFAVGGAIILITDVLLIVGWITGEEKPLGNDLITEKISILVAARNEEDNIERCLISLVKQDYPIDNLEILVGDDASIDKTREKIMTFMGDHPQIQLVDIHSNLGLAKGKSNVLAHLARKASGNYLFITDADTQVPSTWIKTLLKRCQVSSNTGMATAFTAIKSTDLFSSLQNMEWLNAFGMLQVIRRVGIQVTAVGNNMMVKKGAYDKTGGYERLQFSVVEDFQLTKEILNQGFELENTTSSLAKAVSLPAKGIVELVKQRKRWMKGVIQIHWLPKFLLVIRSFTLPMILLLATQSFYLAMIYFMLKWVLGILFSKLIYARLKETLPFTTAVIFEFYSFILTYVSLFYFLLPIKVDWKGRKY